MKSHKKKQPPRIFRPLLWYSPWNDLDVREDAEDIIVNTVNDGSLKHWKWIIKMYGKKRIRDILKKRLKSEFYPESLNLAQVIFSFSALPYARRSTQTRNKKTFSSPQAI